MCAHLLNWEDLLLSYLFPLLYHCEIYLLGFLTVGWTKQPIVMTCWVLLLFVDKLNGLLIGNESLIS